VNFINVSLGPVVITTTTTALYGG